MSRRLLKFKASSDGGYLAKYEVDGKQGTDTITFESTDAPLPELNAALQKMVDHVVAIAEFPVGWRGDIKIIGVTCTYSNDVQGLVITARRELENSNAPLIVNTPHFTREPYNEDSEDDIGIFSSECGDDLDALEVQVFGYVDGDRAQKQLDFGDGTFVGTKEAEAAGVSG